MIEEFTAHLQSLGKSENTIRTYSHDVTMYLHWCQDSFGEEPQLLYRANIFGLHFLYAKYSGLSSAYRK